ncbi:MAG: hypothetical protein WD398_06335 [Cyclobacteriaceae bacterium]
MMGLKGEVFFKQAENWDKKLYQPLKRKELATAEIRWVPYYSWANRGEGEMEVWLPFK